MQVELSWSLYVQGLQVAKMRYLTPGPLEFLHLYITSRNNASADHPGSSSDCGSEVTRPAQRPTNFEPDRLHAADGVAGVARLEYDSVPMETLKALENADLLTVRQPGCCCMFPALVWCHACCTEGRLHHWEQLAICPADG
jgi:hypothetical protein